MPDVKLIIYLYYKKVYSPKICEIVAVFAPVGTVFFRPNLNLRSVVNSLLEGG